MYAHLLSVHITFTDWGWYIGTESCPNASYWRYHNTKQPASFVDFKKGYGEPGTEYCCTAVLKEGSYKWSSMSCNLGDPISTICELDAVV